MEIDCIDWIDWTGACVPAEDAPVVDRCIDFTTVVALVSMPTMPVPGCTPTLSGVVLVVFGILVLLTGPGFGTGLILICEEGLA